MVDFSKRDDMAIAHSHLEFKKIILFVLFEEYMSKGAIPMHAFVDVIQCGEPFFFDRHQLSSTHYTTISLLFFHY